MIYLQQVIQKSTALSQGGFDRKNNVCDPFLPKLKRNFEVINGKPVCSIKRISCHFSLFCVYLLRENIFRQSERLNRDK